MGYILSDLLFVGPCLLSVCMFLSTCIDWLRRITGLTCDNTRVPYRVRLCLWQNVGWDFPFWTSLVETVHLRLGLEPTCRDSNPAKTETGI